MRGVTMKKGALIHSEKPFIHVLSSEYRFDRCDHCYSSHELLRCAGCHYVKYCDRNCQKISWQDHKYECANLQKLPPNRELPNLARLLARIIMKLKRGGTTEKGFYSKNRFRIFKDLMSHYSNLKEDAKKLEHCNCLYQVLAEFMGRDHLPNLPEFVGLYGRATVNSFNILDLDMTSLGTGIYLGASTIDHSCEPNAVATFTGINLQIRTIADIEDYDWSKVRICYIDTLKDRSERDSALYSQYFFHCDCPRCKSSNYEIIENAILCKECTRPINADKENKLCSVCKWKVSEDALQTYEDVVKFIKHQHQVMDNIAYLDACKICLVKMEGVFHPDHILYVKTLDLAYESSIKLQKWDDGAVMGQKLINGYKMYYGTYSPILGYHYLKHAKILLLQNNLSQARKMLEDAQKILKVTHGTEHPLYRVELYNLMYPKNDLKIT